MCPRRVARLTSSSRPVLIVLSGTDPVASALGELWPPPPSSGWVVDGAPIRRWPDGPYLLKRPVHHIHDEDLDLRLPAAFLGTRPTLVFPSIHRSGLNVPSLTVHPIGNPGPENAFGGRAHALVPTDPGLMAELLRGLHERAALRQMPVTYEATHHGPHLGLPALFVEIGYGAQAKPPEPELKLFANMLPNLGAPAEEPRDTVAVGLGGGHYAPHFTDLALKRSWAFGHILSRHALSALDRPTLLAAVEATPSSSGLLFSRAADELPTGCEGVAPRLNEKLAPSRGPGPEGDQSFSLRSGDSITAPDR